MTCFRLHILYCPVSLRTKERLALPDTFLVDKLKLHACFVLPHFFSHTSPSTLLLPPIPKVFHSHPYPIHVPFFYLKYCIFFPMNRKYPKTPIPLHPQHSTVHNIPYSDSRPIIPDSNILPYQYPKYPMPTSHPTKLLHPHTFP